MHGAGRALVPQPLSTYGFASGRARDEGIHSRVMIRVEVQAKDPRRVRGSLLVLPVMGSPSAQAGGAAITAELRRRGFEGKMGERADLGRVTGIAAQRVVACGVGTEIDEREVTRRLTGAAVGEGRAFGVPEVTVALPGTAPGEEHGRALAEGVHLADYRFTAYLGARALQEQKRRVRSVTAGSPALDVSAVKRGVRRGTAEARATMLARDLVNTPSAHMTPRALAEKAREIAKSTSAVTVRVLGPTEIKRLGMEAYAAVGQGSDEPPQFIHLVYTPGSGQRGEGGGERPQRIALVGKGLTFDSGGYSLKTAEGMETMKIDMAGAAAVLGVFSALASWQPRVEVHGLIAACENLVSGRAMKPGDIVQAKNGKTIEVLNTDAEGRLTLADALSYAVELKPDAIIDLATLTGACVVALGEEIAGLFSNNDGLAEQLKRAAAQSGEPLWRMPLRPEYRELLKSELADLRNIGSKGRAAGAITAALFLQEFVGAPPSPWAHLDIAGPAYAEKQTLSYIPAGGTGFGVRTLLHYLEALASEGSRQ